MARNVAKKENRSDKRLTASDVRELNKFTDKCFNAEYTKLKRRVQPSKIPSHDGIKKLRVTESTDRIIDLQPLQTNSFLHSSLTSLPAESFQPSALPAVAGMSDVQTVGQKRSGNLTSFFKKVVKEAVEPVAATYRCHYEGCKFVSTSRAGMLHNFLLTTIYDDCLL